MSPLRGGLRFLVTLEPALASLSRVLEIVFVEIPVGASHRQSLFDGLDDVFVVGVKKVAEYLNRLFRTDEARGSDRRQQQILLFLRLRRGSEDGNHMPPGSVHLPIPRRQHGL